jgi:serine/threonine-protein kinase
MVDDRDDGSSDDTALQSDEQELLQRQRAKRPRTDPAIANTLAAGTNSGPTLAVSPHPEGAARVPSELEASRYRLGEQIGRGGMGEVLLAHDELIGREVAVKRIRSEHPSSEALARFLREARLQGRLEHPAVVPVHDLAFDPAGKPFFVMKRISGTAMSKLLEQLAKADATEAAALRRRLLRAFVDVCLAIELAHQKQIVHRDLKPANIMLGDYGEVYVLDWGIARLATETDEPVKRPSHQGLELDTGQTRAGTVLGTPAYMAPEQLLGERAGARADVYALGCMLYEIAAGVPLHTGKRSLDAEPARPSRVKSDSPPELDVLCEQATRGDPATRPSARALGDGVQAFLDGDRDHELRKVLAREQLEHAKTALAGGDSEAIRRTAMQAAGRALALDPTAREAADVVMQLMLQPPRRTPREVEDTLEHTDTVNAQSQGRLAALTLLGYLAFVPLFLWTGVRDMRLLLAFVGVALGSGAHVLALTRRTRLKSSVIYLNACINAALIAIVCRMIGPFIIAPTLVMTTLMSYAAHPRFGRISVLSLILASGVLVPWGLELFGVISPTYQFIDGKLLLETAALSFHAVPVQLAFAGVLVSLLGVVGLLSRQMARRQREVSERAELQAWHLRQLVRSAE